MPEEGVYEVRLVKYDYCQRLTMQTIDARAEQKQKKRMLVMIVGVLDYVMYCMKFLVQRLVMVSYTHTLVLYDWLASLAGRLAVN